MDRSRDFGQYVEFPVNEDGSLREGYYHIRGTADVTNKLVETNELDNVSYTFIHVYSSGRHRCSGTRLW